MKNFVWLFMPLLLIFALGCSTVNLKEGAEQIIFSEVAPGDKCIFLGNATLRGNLIDVLKKEESNEKLVNRAKNEGFKRGADYIYYGAKQKNQALINEPQLQVKYYTCKKLSEIKLEALGSACDLESGPACAELGIRSQLLGVYSEMKYNFKRSCDYKYQPACSWITTFLNEKSVLRKACIQKDGESCFAAAKLEDVEKNFSLMMTYLKQGCGYGDSESCFYQNYANEERIQNNSKVEYMTNVNTKTIRLKKILDTLSMLDKKLQCVGPKNSETLNTTGCN